MTISVYCMKCGARDGEYDAEDGATFPAECPMCGESQLYPIDWEDKNAGR